VAITLSRRDHKRKSANSQYWHDEDSKARSVEARGPKKKACHPEHTLRRIDRAGGGKTKTRLEGDQL